MMNFRNWIEKSLEKRIAFVPIISFSNAITLYIYVGSKGGRKLYSITFEDGTEKDFYIDFEIQEINEY